jgi:hypothetical protein
VAGIRVNRVALSTFRATGRQRRLQGRALVGDLKEWTSSGVAKITPLLLLLSLAIGAAAPAHAADAKGFNPLKLDGHVVKWGAPRLGVPARVTYAFARGPLDNTSARNCRAMDSLERVARESRLDLADIRGEAVAAFRLWEEASGISFQEVGSVGEANIVIGSQSSPRGYAFTNVQHARQVTGLPGVAAGIDRGLGKAGSASDVTSEKRAAGGPRVSRITQSAICLNPAHRWKIGFDGDLGVYDLRYTFAHEIGHAIGLDHYVRRQSIMHFRYGETFQTLQPGDIEGVQWLYGRPG